jgi:YHS domain-containing protein
MRLTFQLPASKIAANKESTMAEDPVCGMSVDEKKAVAQSVYSGKTYYFCSKVCQKEFEKNPTKYVKPSDSGSCCGH